MGDDEPKAGGNAPQGDEGQKEENEGIQWSWHLIFNIIALAGIALACVSLAMKHDAVVLVYAAISVVVGTIVFIRQFQLRDGDAMKHVQNALRHEVNRLQDENHKLHDQIDELAKNVKKLKESEKKLNSVAKEQGLNVAKLMELVKENGELLRQMKKATRSETLQNLFDIVMYADADQDFTIGSEELPELLMKLNADPRIEVDEEIFKKRVHEHNDKLPVLDVVDDLMAAGEERDPNHIFWFPEHNYAGHHQS